MNTKPPRNFERGPSDEDNLGRERKSLYMSVLKKRLTMDEDLMGSRNTIASITPSSISHSYKPTMAEEMESIISSWSTPLHTAASEGRCDQLNLLLEYPELDINIQTKLYNEFLGVIELDNTPLHLTAQNGHLIATNLLLKYGAMSDIQNSTGSTPLHLAVINGVSVEIIQNLINTEDILSMKDNQGRTALYCAAEEGWDNLIPYLIDHNGAIETPSNSGETPLIIATKNGFSQTINVLIENGAIITTRDKSGCIALDYAMSINERTIQDEQIFDKILTRMLELKSNEEALGYLHSLLEKYYKLRLTGSITSLLDRVSELRARKVIICTRYVETDCNGITPDDPKYSTKTFTALQLLAETGDEELAFHPSVRVIVDKKMGKVGNYYMLGEMVYFFILLFSMFFMFTAAAARPDPTIYTQNIDYIRGVFEVIVAIMWIFTLAIEIAELGTNVIRVYYKETKIAKSRQREEAIFRMVVKSALKMYLKEVFNYFDMLGLVSLFIVLPLRISKNPAQWIFATLAILIHSLRFLKSIRLLPGLGTYVHTITLIAWNDVPKFLIASGMIIVLITESFFIALRVPYRTDTPTNLSTSEIGMEGIYDTFYWTFFFFLRVLLQGESILDGNYLYNDLNWLNAIIYMLALGLIIVILLNIFIAQVSDTYAIASAKSERIVALYRLKFIVRINSWGFIRRRSFLNEIILKSNIWKTYNISNTDEKLEQLMSTLERNSMMIEQLKLKMRKFMQDLHDRKIPPRSRHNSLFFPTMQPHTDGPGDETSL